MVYASISLGGRVPLHTSRTGLPRASSTRGLYLSHLSSPFPPNPSSTAPAHRRIIAESTRPPWRIPRGSCQSQRQRNTWRGKHRRGSKEGPPGAARPCLRNGAGMRRRDTEMSRTMEAEHAMDASAAAPVSWDYPRAEKIKGRISRARPRRHMGRRPGGG